MVHQHQHQHQQLLVDTDVDVVIVAVILLKQICYRTQQRTGSIGWERERERKSVCVRTSSRPVPVLSTVVMNWYILLCICVREKKSEKREWRIIVGYSFMTSHMYCTVRGRSALKKTWFYFCFDHCCSTVTFNK